MDVTIDSKVIGQRLQKIRKSKGLTQAEMATHLNLQTSSYGNFERGSEMPSLKKVIQCCVILGVSPDALLGDCCIGLARQKVQQMEPQSGELLEITALLRQCPEPVLHTIRVALQAALEDQKKQKREKKDAQDGCL